MALLPDLLDTLSTARVIVLTGVRDADEYQAAVRLGALGLVLKDQALDTLIRAIERVHAGEAWLAPQELVARVLCRRSTRAARPTPGTRGLEQLTQREREICRLDL